MPSLSSLTGCALVLGITVISGCATNIRGDRKFIESSTMQSRPISEPVRSITSFSDGLACMDNMLRRDHIPPTLVTSKIIPDPSGKAPVAAKEMIFTALSQMSRTSNAFRVVDFEIDPLRQDTVQTLTSLMLPGGQMAIPKPAIYISGSVSYVDQNVLIKNRGAGASGKNWEIGYSDDVITTVLGMELHIGDFNTRTLFAGIDSANELVAGNKGSGFDAGARIKKAGVQFTMGGSISQGVGPAIRTLVDLGMIELVGKWARVPYWQCLALDQSHPEFQRQLYEWFDAMKPVERVKTFQTGLRSLGYYQGKVDGRTSPALKDALALFQADNRATVSGNANFETYDRLMKNYVASDGNGQFVRIGFGDNAKVANADPEFAARPRNGKPALSNERSGPIGLDISLTRRDPRFQLGESLLLNVSTDQSAYLYCYYQDAKGALTQIYPSDFQPAPIVQAQRSVLVPDITNPNSFTIEMTTPGRESATCFAAPGDIAARLKKGLRAGPLETIKGIRTMAELQKKVVAIAASPRLGTKVVNWEVVR